MKMEVLRILKTTTVGNNLIVTFCKTLLFNDVLRNLKDFFYHMHIIEFDESRDMLFGNDYDVYRPIRLCVVIG